MISVGPKFPAIFASMLLAAAIVTSGIATAPALAEDAPAAAAAAPAAAAASTSAVPAAAAPADAAAPAGKKGKKRAKTAKASSPQSLEARHQVCLAFIQRHGQSCDPWVQPTCGADLGYFRPLECVRPRSQ